MTENLQVPYRSIPDMFLQRVAATPNGNAFAGPGASGPAWLTWQTVGERACNIAAGLHSIGVLPEDRVAIASNTRVEWVLADLGIMCAGAATTTVYPTTEPKDAAFILSDSGSKVLFAEDAAQVQKIAGSSLPALTHIVTLDGADVSASVPVLSLAELEQRGAAALAEDADLVNRIAKAVRPDQLATLMYTSGTTGTPKGVELLHGGWVWEGVAQAQLGILLPNDLQYLWLPLSHSFGKTLICGVIHVGLPTYVDGRIDKIVENLAVVKPTLMCGAPRIFEKVYNRIVTTTKDAGGAKWKIFQWAFGVGRQVSRLQREGKQPSGGLKFKHGLADKLVFSKIRERLGGRIRILVSGAAPLSKDIAEFFHAAGLTILEGYGLTETSAGAFVNRPDAFKFGTVGRPMGDLEVRIAEDGEVELRGTPVMRGYHNLPEESANCFTADGYFKTGDIGEIDPDGYLKITDRKKDLIKTSGGKYVAPSHIEGMFKAICPYVSQVVVIGQARNYVTMVLTLDPEAITAWAAGGPLDGKSYQDIVGSTQAREMVDGYIKQLNERLNRWETVKKFTILPRDFSVETGELTPSLKIKRKVVETTFSNQIEGMYEGTLV
ncbi:MAG TPA: long-chain fatty acid--CoA ligase [Micromonosporaceae bacterium]